MLIIYLLFIVLQYLTVYQNVRSTPTTTLRVSGSSAFSASGSANAKQIDSTHENTSLNSRQLEIIVDFGVPKFHETPVG